MNKMDGKIAFISGGARGLGAETARMMAACGASVIIGDQVIKGAQPTEVYLQVIDSLLPK